MGQLCLEHSISVVFTGNAELGAISAIGDKWKIAVEFRIMFFEFA